MKLFCVWTLLFISLINLDAEAKNNSNELAQQKIYFSRNSGDWSNPHSWSLSEYGGQPTIDYPNTDEDIVYIGAQHTITLDRQFVGVKSLYIENGNLEFASGSNKTLRINSLLNIFEGAGISTSDPGAKRKDTLVIMKNIQNNCSNSDTLNFWINDSCHTSLVFRGPLDSEVSGSGHINLGNLIIDKNTDKKLINKSAEFANAVSDLVLSAVHNSKEFILKFGVYSHDIALNVILDKDDGQDFVMSPNTGIEITSGAVFINDNFISNNKTSVILNGGRLFIGNQQGEGLFYTTGFTFQLNKGKCTIAAGFKQYEPLHSVRLIITGGILQLMDIGDALADDEYAFDLNPQSTIVWNDSSENSKIIYATPVSKGENFRIACSEHNITGGTLQFGIEGNLFASSGRKFSMRSTAPIYNLYLAETRFNTNDGHAAFNLLDDETHILNNINIGKNATFDLNCKSLILYGSFINNGRFTPDGRGFESEGPRRVTLKGNKDQHIFIDKAIINEQNINSMNNEPFYELIVDKDSGSIILDSAKSDLLIRHKLVFSDSNNAVINSAANNRSVNISPRLGDSALIIRNGNGHINGKLVLSVNSIDSSLLFPIGFDTAYTPLEIKFNSLPQKFGKITAQVINGNPKNIIYNGIELDLSKNIQRYWKLTPDSADAFILGNSDFRLSLSYLYPEDIRDSADFGKFKIFDCSKAPYKEFPVLIADEGIISADSISSFGDFLVGELAPYTRKFYSVADGKWTDDIWSNTIGGELCGEYPKDAIDKAVITDGFSVTLSSDDNLSPDVNSVIINGREGKYGHLIIERGELIKGGSFILSDSAFLTIENNSGLSLKDSAGAVQSRSLRSYGKANYTFRSPSGIQLTGNGLPDEVFSLKIDVSDTVILTQKPKFGILGDLHINNGTFLTDSINISISLAGNLNNDTENWLFTNKLFNFVGGHEQHINADSMIIFERIFINKDSGNVTADTNMIINSDLRLVSDSKLIMGSNNLLLGPRAYIYSNLNKGTSFNQKKYIVVCGEKGKGKITKQITDTLLTYPYSVQYTVGTDSLFSPLFIEFPPGTNFVDDPEIILNFINSEHDSVLRPNKSLENYWRINYSGDIFLSYIGCNFVFEYNDENVNGWLPGFRVLNFRDSTWFIDPGEANTINLTTRRVLVEKLQSIDGDWTLGEIDAVGVDEDFSADELIIYPHPAEDFLRIESPKMINELKIINSNGKIVMESAPKDFEHIISVESLTAGMYLVKLELTGGNTVYQKFIKL